MREILFRGKRKDNGEWVYGNYAVTDNDEKKSWAEQAKMRANKTASTYNNYILENSFVWEDNIPSDINYKLEYIE